MVTVRLSRAAREGFDDIFMHLNLVSSRAVVAKFTEQLRERINLLSDFPGTGTPRPDLGETTRVTSVTPYLIIYDGGPQSEVVNVLRILHGHRDITRLLVARGRQP